MPIQGQESIVNNIYKIYNLRRYKMKCQAEYYDCQNETTEDNKYCDDCLFSMHSKPIFSEYIRRKDRVYHITEDRDGRRKTSLMH